MYGIIGVEKQVDQIVQSENLKITTFLPRCQNRVDAQTVYPV